jgi:hypothetical protein
MNQMRGQSYTGTVVLIFTVLGTRTRTESDGLQPQPVIGEGTLPYGSCGVESVA